MNTSLFRPLMDVALSHPLIQKVGSVLAFYEEIEPYICLPDYCEFSADLLKNWTDLRSGSPVWEKVIELSKPPTNHPELFERRRVIRMDALRRIDASLHGKETYKPLSQWAGQSTVSIATSPRIKLGVVTHAHYTTPKEHTEQFLAALQSSEIVDRIESELIPYVTIEDEEQCLAKWNKWISLQPMRQSEGNHVLPSRPCLAYMGSEHLPDGYELIVGEGEMEQHNIPASSFFSNRIPIVATTELMRAWRAADLTGLTPEDTKAVMGRWLS